MSVRLGFFGAWLVFAAGLAGCTDVDLNQLPDPPPPAVDNKLEVRGSVCTQSTEDLEFPLRVLFLVDGSESMEVTDPPDPITGITGREAAVRETVDQLFATGGDVKVSLVRFSSQVQPLTQTFDANGDFLSYFSDDPAHIESRLPLLTETDRTTNYISALGEAYAEVRDELTRADQESLSQSTYHVIMISDGIPDAEQGETVDNSADNILESIEAIMELGRLFHIEELTLSTALLSPPNAAVDIQSEALLESMSDAGNGSFRKFDSGAELNFLFIDLTQLERVFTLRNVVAWNLNSVVQGDVLLPDSDGDGLEDAAEAEFGSNPYTPDSDGDGCRDSLEVLFVQSGLSPLDPDDCDCFVADYCFDDDLDGQCDSGCTDADGDGLCDCIDDDGNGLCDPSNHPDGDGDGLADCEERWSGTNKRGPDTDGDGLVDFHEVRFGTSPDVDDFTDDLDWDAVSNGEEVRTATDPHHVSGEGRFELAYRYNLTETGVVGGGRSCYDFSIGNITLHEVLEPPTAGAVRTEGPGGQGYTGRNRVLVFLGEVPFDDFDSYARFRVACVEAAVKFDGNYRNPPSGIIRIEDDQVVTLAEFDPAIHCLGPGGEPLDLQDADVP